MAYDEDLARAERTIINLEADIRGLRSELEAAMKIIEAADELPEFIGTTLIEADDAYTVVAIYNERRAALRRKP